LRIAISENGLQDPAEIVCPQHAPFRIRAGLQKSIAIGTPSRIANSTV
jgi:hypothetical protein